MAGFDKKKALETVAKGRRVNWWRREGSKSRGFQYLDAKGKRISRGDRFERITGLVIPPAWKFVRINPAAGGKIQAVGVDEAGRLQYIYEPKYAERQARKKFAKIERFGEHLPKLKQLTNKHISLDGLPRDKVLAVVMRLINSLYFRVGTDHSQENYKTFGITTLQKRHLRIGRKGKLEFNFVGKSHVAQRKILVDEELAEIIKDLKGLGRGRKLFRYLDDEGKARAVTPGNINRYIKDATDSEFSSKDFRTWGGTLLAAVELAEIGPGETKTETKKNLVAAIKTVAEELGNTPAVCRSSYIHPAVIKSYEAGITLDEFRPRTSRKISRIETELSPEEKALIKLLKKNGR